jgi:GDPmannose 4,6-dehydratase
MEAAWEIMQLDYCDDFIISAGEAHTVKEFLDEAFAIVNLNSEDFVEFDPKYARPSDTSLLVGDTWSCIFWIKFYKIL